MPTPIVDVRGLAKTYRGWSFGRRRAVEALREVTLESYGGEVFGLLGPNGAGKTTLIKTLLGVIRPSRGDASLFGLPVGSATARRRVGYLPESLRIDPHHTARTALRFYGRLSGMDAAAIRRRSDELLELVGLRDRDRESVRRFSKGMNQRLGLAQALMHQPDLLILDEPTDGLDPVGRSSVRRLIERLRDDGKTIFLNSHILQEVELVCGRVAIMSRGRIRAVGTIEELARGREGDRVCIDVTPPDRDGHTLATADDPCDSLRNELCRLDGIVDGTPGVTVSPLAGTDRIRVTLPCRDQRAVDHAVDLLRRQRFSITSLATHRRSLEETFLELVGDGSDDDESDRDTPARAAVRDAAAGATAGVAT